MDRARADRSRVVLEFDHPVLFLVAFIKKQGADRVCFEATGAYHRDLEYALSRSGMSFVKANPRRSEASVRAVAVLS